MVIGSVLKLCKAPKYYDQDCRLNLVYIIGTKQGSDCVFPSGLWEKATVYKQLGLRWQIAKQLSGFGTLSLSNNKNYRLRKSEVFPF